MAARSLTNLEVARLVATRSAASSLGGGGGDVRDEEGGKCDVEREDWPNVVGHVKDNTVPVPNP